MKQSEAVRIPALLAARQPRPTVQESTIEGIRMLVILGNEVDTVIRYNRNGGADMPQLSTYPDLAEAAAHADERDRGALGASGRLTARRSCPKPRSLSVFQLPESMRSQGSPLPCPQTGVSGRGRSSQERSLPANG
jgi:hypothetical protein